MTAVDTTELILVRYGELALKGKNRRWFEDALARNVRHALAPFGPLSLERSQGRLAVFPGERVEEAAERLRDVFGISSVSPAVGVEPTFEAIAAAAKEVLEDALLDFPPARPLSFRVRSSRAEKRFPLTSMELDREVAEAILEPEGRHAHLAVQLKGAQLELGIDVRPERAYVFARRLAGAGGLPVGTLGRVMCLLSGGIDSPVAAYLAMKRGCRVAFVSFHSPPFIGEGSRRKVERLVRSLDRYQPVSRLYVVPFAKIQTAIRDASPEPYRTVLYRRMMQRIASRLCERDGATALVTGESLGQVASQTLENMTCIEEAADLPVLRPLLAHDKTETIAIARRIGTLELSNEPEPDCCTVFQPRRPIIRGRVRDCHAAEAELPIEELLQAALEGVEVLDSEGR